MLRGSDVNKDLGFKAKAKDLSLQGQGLELQGQGQGLDSSPWVKAKDLKIGP